MIIGPECARPDGAVHLGGGKSNTCAIKKPEEMASGSKQMNSVMSTKVSHSAAEEQVHSLDQNWRLHAWMNMEQKQTENLNANEHFIAF